MLLLIAQGEKKTVLHISILNYAKGVEVLSHSLISQEWRGGGGNKQLHYSAAKTAVWDKFSSQNFLFDEKKLSHAYNMTTSYKIKIP